MATFNLKIDGLQATINNLKKLPKEVEHIINDELNDFGLRTVGDAKKNITSNGNVDRGFLRNSINYEKKNLEVTINVSANYAAYQEFGTRRFAAAYVGSLPADWQTFAAQFKGKGGGSFDELVMRITQWVKRKGIEEKAAYPIALKILREGIKPQPYLRPAVEKNIIELKKNLKLVK